MKTEEAITRSRQQQLVADDKFEKHINIAHTRDISSLQAIFCQLSVHSLVQCIKRRNLLKSK